MPRTNLHKVLNLAKVHNHIARTGYIYKKSFFKARFPFEMVRPAMLGRISLSYNPLSCNAPKCALL
jgi:hypothetical protein